MDLVYESDGNEIALNSGGISGNRVKESTLVEKIHDLAFPPYGLLPLSVRWISPMRRWILLERPPTEQTIVYRPALAHEISYRTKEYVFHIPLPWTAMFIRLDFDDLYPSAIAVYSLGSSSMSGFNKHVSLLPFPNHYLSGWICLADRNYNDPTPKTIGEAIELAHLLAWQGSFNLDMQGAFARCRSVGAPPALFQSGEEDPVVTFSRWEQVPLHDVCRWSEVHPNGWDTVAEAEDASLGTIGSIITVIQDEERAFIDEKFPQLLWSLAYNAAQNG